jgi:hypothetical protein
MEEQKTENKRPIAGMRALALGAFCAFGVFAISIGIGMSSVLAGKKLLVKMSSDQALTFDYGSTSVELYKEVLRKMQMYADNAKGESKLEFTLSASELNSLLRHDAQFDKIKNSLLFRIENETLYADVSWPLSWAGGMEEEGVGLFFNGVAKLQLFVKGNELRLFFEGFYQDGQRLEVDAVNVYQQVNLLEYLTCYDQCKDDFNKVVDVRVDGDRLRISNWLKKETVK